MPLQQVDWGGAQPIAQPPPPAFTALGSAARAAQTLAASTSTRTTGIIVAVISIVFSAPDATLLRCLQQDGTPNSSILVWKMLLYSWIQFAFAVHQDGSMDRVLRRAVSAWPWMLVGSICMCVEWLATLANLTTSSASALCLFYIAPLWAVPMGMVVNSDALHTRTLVAMAVALAGIFMIFAPNLMSPAATSPTDAFDAHAFEKMHRKAHPTHSKPMHHGQHEAPSSLFGDLCGLFSGLAFAAWITTCRHASLHRPDAPLALCGALGTFAVVIPAALLAVHRGDDLLDVTPRFVVFVLMDCAAIAAYNIGTMVASKYLPSAELGLYLTLDVVFAPFLVWGVHGEVPTKAVLEGGGLLVAALLAHEAIALVAPTNPPPLGSPKLRNSDANLLALVHPDESSQPLKQWAPNDEGS